MVVVRWYAVVYGGVWRCMVVIRWCTVVYGGTVNLKD
jgi:hypothetical protein